MRRMGEGDWREGKKIVERREEIEKRSGERSREKGEESRGVGEMEEQGEENRGVGREERRDKWAARRRGEKRRKEKERVEWEKAASRGEGGEEGSCIPCILKNSFIHITAIL